MNKFEFIQTIRQLIAEGKTDEALTLMRMQVAQFDPSLVTDATLLENRHTNAFTDFNLKGILSRTDYDRTVAQVNYALLEIVEKLEKTVLLPTVSESAISTSTAKNKNSGRILHNIPGIMPVDKERRCIVRIAYDDETLLRDLKADENITIQNVRISEVMGVELVDFNETPAFSIRTITEEEQFISSDDYTQWLFMVKALREGRFSLTLKVAVIEEVNGKERKRDIVLEKEVFIISHLEEPPAATATTSPSVENMPQQPSATHFEDTSVRFNYTVSEENGGVVSMPSKRFSMSGVMSMLGVIVMAMGGWVTFQTFKNTQGADIVLSKGKDGSNSPLNSAGTTDTLGQMSKPDNNSANQLAENSNKKDIKIEATPTIPHPVQEKKNEIWTVPAPQKDTVGGNTKPNKVKTPTPKVITKPTKTKVKRPVSKPKPAVNSSSEGTSTTVSEPKPPISDAPITPNTSTNVAEKQGPVKTFRVRLVLKGAMKKAEISVDGQSVDKYLKKNFWGTPQYIEFKSSKERHTITFKRDNISCSITDVLIENGDMTVEPCSFD